MLKKVSSLLILVLVGVALYRWWDEQRTRRRYFGQRGYSFFDIELFP